MINDIPASDLRRLWIILGAVITLERPTLVSIVKATSMPKGSVNDKLLRLMSEQVPGLQITKVGPVYSITSWSEECVLSKAGIVSFYKKIYP